MLSKDLKDLFDELDAGDPQAKRRRAVYSALFDVAKQIRLMRKASGLSVRQFAKELNTSHATVLRWERPGYAGYTISKLIEISHALGYRLVLDFIPMTGNVLGKNDWDALDLTRVYPAAVDADKKSQSMNWGNITRVKGVASNV